MTNEVYKNEYGVEEKCFNCNEFYKFYGLDTEEPLKIYKCKCGKKKYKEIHGYEG